MTADIVTVCRMKATLASTAPLCAVALYEAADEIERLRGVIGRAHSELVNGCYWDAETLLFGALQ